MTTTKQRLLTIAEPVVEPAPLGADLDAGYNENQAATFLGVSVRTLQAWRVRGGGPKFAKLGRAVRYQRRTLIDFALAHTVRSTSEADARRWR
jgi:hypothetical protein